MKSLKNESGSDPGKLWQWLGFFPLFSAVFPISPWLFSGLFGYFYHIFYIHFAAPPWFLFLSAPSFVCPVSKIFFPFSLSSFLAANILIQAVICIVIPIFSADCWLHTKQSRWRQCQSSCAWASGGAGESPWEQLLLCCRARGLCTSHRAAGSSLITARGQLISAQIGCSPWPPVVEVSGWSLNDATSLCGEGTATFRPFSAGSALEWDEMGYKGWSASSCAWFVFWFGLHLILVSPEPGWDEVNTGNEGGSSTWFLHCQALSDGWILYFQSQCSDWPSNFLYQVNTEVLLVPVEQHWIYSSVSLAFYILRNHW